MHIKINKLLNSRHIRVERPPTQISKFKTVNKKKIVSLKNSRHIYDHAPQTRRLRDLVEQPPSEVEQNTLG